MIDTHSHIDGEEYRDDRPETIARARQAGVEKILVPAIDAATSRGILQLCSQYPGYLFPMVGLHPEEVKADWQQQLDTIKAYIPSVSQPPRGAKGGLQSPIVAIGEVGLDYYWTREYEKEQLQAFERQVQWSVETRLPLMIHCRKAQNEMVALLKNYEKELPGGVFHCFTGNAIEAAELLRFERFALGIGGVLTFKKSHLPEVLPSIPLDRIVLETDAPYMAPVPKRGQRNESAFIVYVLERMAEAYGIDKAEIEARTTKNVARIFGV